MEKIIKELLKSDDFVRTVAEEMGQQLAKEKMEDTWFQDWNNEFYKTLQETVNKAVLEQVNDYMEQYKVKGLIDTAVRAYLVKNISDILEKKV